MTRIRWTARKIGIAHAHQGRAPRTACGMTAIAETEGWPAKSKCPACLTALGEPLTQTLRLPVETDDPEQAMQIARERAERSGRTVVSAQARMQDWGYVVVLEVAA